MKPSCSHTSQYPVQLYHICLGQIALPKQRRTHQRILFFLFLLRSLKLLIPILLFNQSFNLSFTFGEDRQMIFYAKSATTSASSHISVRTQLDPLVSKPRHASPKRSIRFPIHSQHSGIVTTTSTIKCSFWASVLIRYNIRD